MKCKCGNPMMQSSMKAWTFMCVSTFKEYFDNDGIYRRVRIPSCDMVMVGTWKRGDE